MFIYLFLRNVYIYSAIKGTLNWPNVTNIYINNADLLIFQFIKESKKSIMISEKIMIM